MFFASDNTSGAHPAVIDALARANEGNTLSYGADAWSIKATQAIRDLFEAPEAEVFFVGTGTAANSLALAAIAKAWEVIYCTDIAHIYLDECNGPEFYTGGAKLRPIPSENGLLDPTALEAAILATHAPKTMEMQRGPLSITNLTEAGTIYTPDHVARLSAIARAHGLTVHMDGARFTNALVALGCTPAELTWRAGVDILSFGGTKNGMLGAEAVVIFSPELADNFAFRRRRGAHLFSKQRYLAAQFVGALNEGLWRDMAAHANTMGQRLSRGLAKTPGVTLAYPTEANMVFVEMPRGVHRRLAAAGAEYAFNPAELTQGDDATPLPARLVAGWSTTEADVDQYLAHARG